MSSSLQSKRKRDDTQDIGDPSATQMPMSDDNSCEEVPVQPKNKCGGSCQTQRPIEGGYRGTSVSYSSYHTKAEYWKDFKLYLSKEGVHRAECKFCSVTYAADRNNNGTKNVRNHWLACPKNPANEGKGKQKKLILEHMDDKPGHGKLKNWVLNVSELRAALCSMVIIEELPFRFVAKPGFNYMMSKACPEYTLFQRLCSISRQPVDSRVPVKF